MKFYSLLLFLFTTFFSIYSQTFLISGIIIDKNSKEPLVGASILNTIFKDGTTTNINGYFLYRTNKDTISLDISYAGYEKTRLNLFFTKDTFINIYLETSNVLKEVIIKASTFRNNFFEGKSELSSAKLQKIPTIGSEKDILRILTVLPGVSSTNEGFTGFNVRGGSSDQNLFILDGAPVNNTGHFFSFVSVFNSEIIKKVEFYKNSFPAEYGDRLSSVTNIILNDGNYKRYEGNIDIGVINSMFTLEGPVGKNEKLSFIIAGRSTYLDIFNLGKAKKIEEGVISDYTGYTFADCNLKFSFSPSQKNKFSFSFYSGIDRLKFENNYTGSVSF